MTIPSVSTPDITLPSLTTPDVNLPSVSTPDITLPSLITPDATIPSVTIGMPISTVTAPLQATMYLDLLYPL